MLQARVIDNGIRVGHLFRNGPHSFKKLLSSCGNASLEVVGLLNSTTESMEPEKPLFRAFLEDGSSLPRIEFQMQYDVTVQLITFSRPDPNSMQYTSLQSISLALTDMSNRESPSANETLLDDVDAADIAEAERVAVLVEKMKLHSVIKHTPTAKELALPMIIKQINCCFEINALMQRNLKLIRSRRRRTLSVSERVVESAMTLSDYVGQVMLSIYTEIVYPLAAQLFIIGLMMQRVIGELLIVLGDWRIRPQDAAIKDVSATAQQVDLRLQQFCYWPIQYITLRERRNDWASLATNQAEYIRFYNSLWLVANDVIMGIAIGSFIVDNADAVADHITMLLTSWSLEGLRRMISWLMVYPAGLKLNTELARFLGDLFLWVIDYWAGKDINNEY